MEKIIATVIMLGVVMGLFATAILPNVGKTQSSVGETTSQIDNTQKAINGGISGAAIVDLMLDIQAEKIKDTTTGDGKNQINFELKKPSGNDYTTESGEEGPQNMIDYIEDNNMENFYFKRKDEVNDDGETTMITFTEMK